MSQKDRIPAALSLDGLGSDARAAFDLAAQSGYRGVAIPTNHQQLNPAELGGTARRHLRQVLQSRQLQTESLRVAAPRAGLSDPASIERTMDNARTAIALARDLGVRTVALHTGPLDDPKINRAAYEEAARTLAAEADKAGVLLALSADSSSKLQELLINLNAPMLKMNLEPGRIIAAGEDALAMTTRLSGLIAEVTGADVIRAGRQIRAAEIGQGQVPWQELLDLLREQDFPGPLVVDLRDLPQSPHAAANAADALRPLLAGWRPQNLKR